LEVSYSGNECVDPCKESPRTVDEFLGQGLAETGRKVEGGQVIEAKNVGKVMSEPVYIFLFSENIITSSEMTIVYSVRRAINCKLLI
jgi:hypothetical protein